MSLPKIDIITTNTIYSIPEAGNLVYQYKPFYNLKRDKPDEIGKTMTPIMAAVPKTFPNNI